jgi:hypothetical protein
VPAGGLRDDAPICNFFLSAPKVQPGGALAWARVVTPQSSTGRAPYLEVGWVPATGDAAQRAQALALLRWAKPVLAAHPEATKLVVWFTGTDLILSIKHLYEFPRATVASVQGTSSDLAQVPETPPAIWTQGGFPFTFMGPASGSFTPGVCPP